MSTRQGLYCIYMCIEASRKYEKHVKTLKTLFELLMRTSIIVVLMQL